MRGRTAVSVPGAAAADWAALSTPSTVAGSASAGSLSGLVEPAQRWLARAVPAGCPQWSAAELSMLGQIRLGSTWRDFTARQVIRPGQGFVWAARTRLAGAPVTGFDRYTTAGGGQMQWRLLGIVPVVYASGEDVTRSAAGRLAAESITVPTACRHAVWSAGPEPDTAVMSWALGGQRQDVQVRVDAQGRLGQISMLRWGNPEGGVFGPHPFGAALSAEQTFGGVRMPTVLRAGWGWGTDRQDAGEFFRARITDVTFR